MSLYYNTNFITAQLHAEFCVYSAALSMNNLYLYLTTVSLCRVSDKSLFPLHKKCCLFSISFIIAMNSLSNDCTRGGIAVAQRPKMPPWIAVRERASVSQYGEY